MNADVLDMLKGGLSQEIVIAKIKASACDFDTSPAALKALKAANVPDIVILAMVEAPGKLQMPTDEVSTPGRADNCRPSDLIPVFPSDEVPIGGTGSHAVAFYARCGDRMTLLGPTDETQDWLKMRAEDGRVGYISSHVVTKLRTTEAVEEGTGTKKQQDIQQQSAAKREDIQKANDDLEDCQIYFQNDYNTRINLLGTLSLAPMVKVAAAARLKQSLDTELRQCRTQYEQRMAAIEGRTTAAPSRSTAPVASPPPAASAVTSQTANTKGGETPGTVSVKSNPAGAEVYVDDSLVGKTPVTIELKPGQHSFRLSRPGYESWVQPFTVDVGANLYIAAALKKK